LDWRNVRNFLGAVRPAIPHRNEIRGPSFLGHEVVHSRAFGDKALKHLSPARFRVFTIVAAAGWKYYFSVAETVYTIMLALHGPGDPSHCL
jgi:hypothetical protein